jgi:hypothetical protein
MKKKIIIGVVILAVVIAAAVIFIQKKKSAPVSTGAGSASASGLQRMLADMQTPGTQVYNEMAGYNKQVYPGKTFESLLQGHIDYHSNPSNPDAFINRPAYQG